MILFNKNRNLQLFSLTAINKFNINPQKILLVRTDRIGDVILTLPMIDTLNYNFPGSKIDFLVNKRVSELVYDYPNINKVHAIEKDTISDIKQICLENNYDLAIIVHPEYSIAKGIYSAGVKYRLGTANRWYSFLFNIKHKQHRKYSVKHELKYNLDLLNELNCKQIDNIAPKLNVTDETISDVKRKLSSSGINVKDNFIVIHIPSLKSAKVWSDDNFIKLINLITGDNLLQFKIILTGTKDDTSQVKGVVSKLVKSKKVFSIFDLNLRELAGLLKEAKLFIGNSTGPVHIAAAVGTFVIGLYSPVRVESPTRWGPYNDKKKIFVPEKADNSKDVMDAIRPEEVYDFIKEFFRL